MVLDSLFFHVAASFLSTPHSNSQNLFVKNFFAMS